MNKLRLQGVLLAAEPVFRCRVKFDRFQLILPILKRSVETRARAGTGGAKLNIGGRSTSGTTHSWDKDSEHVGFGGHSQPDDYGPVKL
jgi:hypothetical protein